MKEKFDILIIILIGLIITLLVIFYVSMRGDMTILILKEGFWDFTNWVAIIVTIGSSVIIAISILVYTKMEQDKITKIVDEQNFTRIKKREFAKKKISLALTIIDEILKEDEPDYEEALQYFNKIMNTIGYFSESLESTETQSILELAEIGEIMCKNNGSFMLRSDRTWPFVTNSIPATLSSLKQLIQDNMELFINKNEEVKCFCGNKLPCQIHVNKSVD